MKREIERSERRKFLKRGLGIGAAVWCAPAIISVSANRAHAQLSGGGDIRQGSFEDPKPERRPRPHSPRPRPRD